MSSLFADDYATVARENSDLLLMLDCFSEASKLFGLTISLQNIEVLRKSAPSGKNTAPVITIDSTQLAYVESSSTWGK